MLQLNNITKDYLVGEEKIPALKGVSLSFREKEFVSILGQSGCGKTTLLNIIGGLDQYSGGDLMIDGKSTKTFTAKEWDSYRNDSIGFVFQNYNLVSHLTILENVEMSLALSGVTAKEKAERAKKALEEVGLKDQLKKKPNQLSGGQMQRVAIARALVNNPSILLADEPTGALDSETSVAVMNLIHKISKDRLVIMVTHNPQIANEYSDRIISMLDGNIISDSNPMEANLVDADAKLKTSKTSMSFFMALKSSLKNLWSKKARTFLTAFAGSIGIIGVALVLAISNGMTGYIGSMQSEQLSGFPITIDESMLKGGIIMGPPTDINQGREEFPTDNKYYPVDDNKYASDLHTNIFTDEFFNYINKMDKSYYNSITYSRDVDKILVRKNGDMYSSLNFDNTDNMFSSPKFSELPDSKDFIQSQYDLLDGKYPETINDLVLVVDSTNGISSSILATLGYDENKTLSVEELMKINFKVVMNDDYYLKNGTSYIPNNNYEQMYNSSDSIELNLVGIMRIKEDTNSNFLSSGLFHTTALTDMIIEKNTNSNIVIDQKANTTMNLITATPIPTPEMHKAILSKLGGLENPTGIAIYPTSYETKELIKDYIDKYNEGKSEENSILYSDLAEQITSSMTGMIDTISIILIAFAAISLVVSSIMIGIISYISVIERTKEIGIMRAIGARKKDISRIFNAESLIIGFSAGFIGIVITALISLIATGALTSIVGSAFSVSLNFFQGLILMCISMFLTFISGLIPARIASKKDPVVALRTE